MKVLIRSKRDRDYSLQDLSNHCWNGWNDSKTDALNKPLRREADAISTIYDVLSNPLVILEAVLIGDHTYTREEFKQAFPEYFI